MEEIHRFFIVGCGRSGTSLLQSLIASHPRVHTFPETHFFNTKIFVPLEKLPSIMKEFLNKKKIRGCDSYWDHIPTSKEEAACTFISMLDDSTRLKGKDMWIEKSPVHIHRIEAITSQVPKAQFIHVLRNAMPVVASRYKATHLEPTRWGGGAQSLTQCFLRWKGDIDISLQYIDYPNHFFVRYENLTRYPERVVRDVCTFMGIEYTPQMFEGFATTAKDIMRHDVLPTIRLPQEPVMPEGADTLEWERLYKDMRIQQRRLDSAFPLL